MKKLFALLLLMAALPFCLTACGNKVITGTVTDFDVEYILVETEASETLEIRDYLRFMSAGKGWTIGDVVEIEYSGKITPTDPATLEEIHDLRVIEASAD